MTIGGCSFVNNSASPGVNIRGGAIYNFGGNLTIVVCSFVNNSVNGTSFPTGGAIYNYEGNLTVSACSFVNNSANGGSNFGGAIVTYNGILSVISCDFLGNSAGFGGAIYNFGGNLTVSACSFVNNSAGYGGAIYNFYMGLNVVGCSFVNNSANGSGGAIYNMDGNLTVNNSSFVGNSANDYGGVLYNNNINNNGNATISYCILSNNTANQIYNVNNGLVLANYNWWGSNNNPNTNGYVDGFDVDNWFVMVLNSTNSSVKVGDRLYYNYYFLLNDTVNGVLLSNANASLIPDFNVSFVYNGSVVKVVDGRFSDNFSFVASDMGANKVLSAVCRDVVVETYFTVKGISSVIVSHIPGWPFFTLSAKVFNQNGDPIVGVPVLFLDAYGRVIANVTTNANGTAEYMFSPNYDVGTYKYFAGFLGDDNYTACSGTDTIVINKVGSKLFAPSTSTVNNGSKVVLSAVLKDVNGKLLANKLVGV
ncbi:MAG: hypothetical protein ACRC1M_06615, partial [Methanobacteriaceae archaeon]